MHAYLLVHVSISYNYVAETYVMLSQPIIILCSVISLQAPYFSYNTLYLHLGSGVTCPRTPGLSATSTITAPSSFTVAASTSDTYNPVSSSAMSSLTMSSYATSSSIMSLHSTAISGTTGYTAISNSSMLPPSPPVFSSSCDAMQSINQRLIDSLHMHCKDRAAPLFTALIVVMNFLSSYTAPNHWDLRYKWQTKQTTNLICLLSLTLGMVTL